MKLKYLLLTSFISSLAFAKELPFKFSEPVEYQTSADDSFLGLTKMPDFAGIITRVSLDENKERNLELYDFSGFEGALTKRTTKEFCQKMADRVFGPKAKISLVSKDPELFASPRNGSICRIILFDDKDKQASFPERHFFTFIADAKAYGLVARFQKKATSEEALEVQNFIKGLRKK